MSSETADINKVSFAVNSKEIEFFRVNYPIHYQVLQELIKRGEARITDNGEVRQP